MGTYTEKLKSGGDLNISKDSWGISYYFRGLDMRYKGTFVRINGKEIDEYIEAWKNNFKQYLNLKEAIPSEGNFTTSGEKGMTIRLGFSSGVCLRSYHMSINTEERLNKVIQDYTYAKKRAKAIQDMLKAL